MGEFDVELGPFEVGDQGAGLAVLVAVLEVGHYLVVGAVGTDGLRCFHQAPPARADVPQLERLLEEGTVDLDLESLGREGREGEEHQLQDPLVVSDVVEDVREVCASNDHFRGEI